MSVAPLDPRQLQKIRLGMSAKLTVTTYRNEQAIVVPPEAIRHEGDRLFVDVRQAPGASVMAQQVKIGRSTPEGVEVFEVAARSRSRAVLVRPIVGNLTLGWLGGFASCQFIMLTYDCRAIVSLATKSLPGQPS